jgi:hypothetical protein
LTGVGAEEILPVRTAFRVAAIVINPSAMPPAYFLCAAQEISESQVLNAYSALLKAPRESVTICK